MAYCPKCRSEYREGFSVCADCKVALVAQLAERKEEPRGDDELTDMVPRELDPASLKFITVFVSDQVQEADAVRMRLTDHNIPFVTRGEQETRFRYVDFLVREDKFVEAKNLLKDIIEKESEGIDLTSIPAEKAPEETQQGHPETVNPSISSQSLDQPRKGSNNFFIVILIVALLGVIAVPAIALRVKYMVGGVFLVMLALVIMLSRDKHL